MWRKSGTKLQGRYPATPSGGFMLGLDEFVYLAKSNLNLTIWLVQMHSKLASLVRNNIWTCQIVKFALDFAKNTNPSRPSINPPVGVAGSVLIYIIIQLISERRGQQFGLSSRCSAERLIISYHKLILALSQTLSAAQRGSERAAMSGW
jgi:hypothetical protein